MNAFFRGAFFLLRFAAEKKRRHTTAALPLGERRIQCLLQTAKTCLALCSQGLGGFNNKQKGRGKRGKTMVQSYKCQFDKQGNSYKLQLEEYPEWDAYCWLKFPTESDPKDFSEGLPIYLIVQASKTLESIKQIPGKVSDWKKIPSVLLDLNKGTIAAEIAREEFAVILTQMVLQPSNNEVKNER
jgi:hypothetical protein